MKYILPILAAMIATSALADTTIDSLRPRAIAGDPEAQVDLGQAYQIGRGVPIDLKLAEDWFRRAAQSGSAEGRDNYGLILFRNGKRAEGLPLIEDAAGRGNPRAQYVLGTALYNGDMIARDAPRAYAMMLRASASGIPAAAVSLAELDRFVPLAQRTRGKALAAAFEAHASATAVVAPVTVTKPATPKPTPPIKTSSHPSGNWRIQLAAFTNNTPAAAIKAASLWTSLHKRIPALAPYRSYVVNVGPITRLHAGPLISRKEANSLCATVRKANQPCIPIAP